MNMILWVIKVILAFKVEGLDFCFVVIVFLNVLMPLFTLLKPLRIASVLGRCYTNKLALPSDCCFCPTNNPKTFNLK